MAVSKFQSCIIKLLSLLCILQKVDKFSDFRRMPWSLVILGDFYRMEIGDRQKDSGCAKDVTTAYRESQERLLRVITDAPIILWAMDLQGMITLSEGKGLAKLGLAPGELVGQSMFERNSGRPDVLEYIRRALKGEETTSLLENNGEVFETHYSPQFDAAGEMNGVIAVSVVITERKKAEEALQESENRYRSLIDNSLDGILLTAPDGSILSANTAACQIFGMSENELCQAGRAGVVDFSDPHVVSFLAEREKTGKARGELTLMRKGGMKFPAEVASAVFTDRDGHLRTSMIIRDITQQKLAQEALLASDEQYQSIFNATRDGLFINDLSGRLVDFNPEACRMLGYTEEEFSLLQPSQFIHPNSMHIFEAYLSTVRDGRQFHGRAVGRRKDGSSFPAEVFGIPIIFHRQPHALAVVRDITEQVHAYQLLEQRVGERTRELSALLDVSRKVASTLELRPLLALILNQLSTVVDYSGAAVITLEDDEFVIVDYVGPISYDQATQTRIPLSSATIFKQVVTHLSPLIIADLWKDTPENHAIFESLTGSIGELFRYAHSWIGVPLSVRDCLVGILSVDHIKSGTYSQQDARLVWAFADQAAVAIDNARLYKQAQELAALEERQKLARELHDSVSQDLYGIALGARTARSLLEGDPSQAIKAMDYCLSLAEVGLAEMRSLIFELRPESLENEGLVAALSKQADALQARLGIQVATSFCDEPGVTLEIKQVYYRVAQEALQNIFKHAQASQVLVKLDNMAGILCMSIQDNGRGFDVHGNFAGHMGLISMRERVKKINGKIVIRSISPQGTEIQVEVEIPLKPGSTDRIKWKPSGVK
jgi:PAS domain S-box-containing protein